jgi:2-iminobutanoate/2-iminopropanoate deaminase
MEVSMSRRQVVPVDPELFTAIGGRDTWSDANIFGDLVWITGQIGWDKRTGELVQGIQPQTERALENLKEVLHRAGSSLSNVLLTRIYITEHDNYPLYDEVYQRYFPTDPPSRITVVVADNIDHALIDIEAVAVRDS